VFAGDIDANKPLDRTLPQENGFRDAYLELGVKEDAEEGCTWDFQGQEIARKRYGPTRLDKVLYCGEIGADRSRESELRRGHRSLRVNG
jgi:tyrosyl-DNA phosphodiesterase 2